MRGCAMLAGAATLMLAAPSLAQDVERYQLERTENGYVRLDTATGRMSLCEERGGQLVCKMAAEERAAYDRQVDDLEGRIDRLEGRVAALEAAGPAKALPTDEEFEQTMGYMEKFFRRFMGIVQDFERAPAPEAPKPEADRT